MKCSKQKSAFKNQKGVALIVLMSFVMTMAPMTIYLMDHSLQNHQVAMNSVNRMKSYYLAKSAVNFSKLILHYDKIIRGQLEKRGVSASQAGNLSQPLYSQIPLDTELIKSQMNLFLNTEDSSDEDSDISIDDNDDENSDEDANDSALSNDVSSFEKDRANEFFSFEGFFRAFISEEHSKYPVNAINKIDASHSSYDLHKQILLSLLMSPELETAFEDQETEALDLTHAIGDYVDINTSINEFNQVERGNENSLYDNVEFRPKNTKFLTQSELRLVPGMNDKIYQFLEPLVTVYHTESTLNVCLADETIFRQLLVLYTHTSGCTRGLDPERDQEEIDELVEQALILCPDTVNIANVVNVGLGLQDSDTLNRAAVTANNKRASSATIAGCDVQFIDLISDKNEIFTIEAEGQVEKVRTKIKVVVDASNDKPSQWKTLYYQVQ